MGHEGSGKKVSSGNGGVRELGVGRGKMQMGKQAVAAGKAVCDAWETWNSPGWLPSGSSWGSSSSRCEQAGGGVTLVPQGPQEPSLWLLSLPGVAVSRGISWG